jgi:putative transposase
MDGTPDSQHRHRIPGEITGHPVRLYRTFGLSFRDVEPLLAERGVVVSHQSVAR